MDGFVYGSRKADDEGQNIADDKGRFEIAALHFLHLKHNGIGQAGDNGKKIAEHAAGGDLIKEKAYNTDQCNDACKDSPFIRPFMIEDPEDKNQKNRMCELQDDGIGGRCHFGGTDKCDAHGS